MWGGSFAADDPYPAWETLSTLRLLAVARGDAAHERIDQDQARRLLERIVALHVDWVMGQPTETQRGRTRRAGRILEHVLEALPEAHILQDIEEELQAVMAQRPVWTRQVRHVLRLMRDRSQDLPAGLQTLVDAAFEPTPLARRNPDPADYDKALDDADIHQEALQLGARLRSTGLAAPHHAVFLVKHRNDLDAVADALGLDPVGRGMLERHSDWIASMIEAVLQPSMAQTCYGLARFLETGLPDAREVRTGLDHLFDIRPDKDAKEILRGCTSEPVPAVRVLASGMVRVLGQPLGVGQGNQPTCQAARAISLWARHRPGRLLETTIHAATRGDVTLDFEGRPLRSSLLGEGLLHTRDPELDPVSAVLVPHLDRLYAGMMRLCEGRPEDAHKWVNPALYGDFVMRGFRSCFNVATYHVVDHVGFVRDAYATLHPKYSDGWQPGYGMPVGLTVTDSQARLFGLHAVTLQRVAENEGTLRAYFYNPNNEGRQDWGDGIMPSVEGNGETEGESSLPFDAFVSRLYAFHHPEPIPGDPAKVPAKVADAVSERARKSWGRSYVWDDGGAVIAPAHTP